MEHLLKFRDIHFKVCSLLKFVFLIPNQTSDEYAIPVVKYLERLNYAEHFLNSNTEFVTSEVDVLPCSAPNINRNTLECFILKGSSFRLNTLTTDALPARLTSSKAQLKFWFFKRKKKLL